MAKYYGHEVQIVTLKNNHGSKHSVPLSTLQFMQDRWEE